MTRFLPALAILLTSAAAVQAAGPSTPVTPTPTTEVCPEGMVWDAAKDECVTPVPERFDDNTLYDMAVELAYAGRYEDAITVLQLAVDQADPRIQTYYGFAHRKAGRMEIAMAYYEGVIAAHPDALLARSYYGQALLQDGNHEGAWAQLAEITARGGAGSWAHEDLVRALRARGSGTY